MGVPKVKQRLNIFDWTAFEGVWCHRAGHQILRRQGLNLALPSGSDSHLFASGAHPTAYHLRAKRLGFALGDIGELLDLYEADGGLIEQGRLVLLRIHQRIEELERQRDDIESTVSEMKQISRNLSQQMADRAAQRDEREENALIGYGVVPSTT